MRGKITARAVNPLDQEYELTIKFTISDWRVLRNQFDNSKTSSYPAFHLIDAINKVVAHAEDHFSQEITSE
jgi:hypothetical protein